MKLYSNCYSRGITVEWYLKEIGTPYEFVEINLKAGDQRSDWFLKINPVGKVPAIEDEGLKVFETAACLMYIAEKYDGADTIQKRAELAKWVVFTNATLEPAFYQYEQNHSKLFPECMTAIEATLGDNDYLLGGPKPSVADVMVASALLYALFSKSKYLYLSEGGKANGSGGTEAAEGDNIPKTDMCKWPKVVAFIKRMASTKHCPEFLAAAVKT